MVFYSFYTDKWKSPESLVYRIENDGHPDNPLYSPLQVNLKMFDDKASAMKDFFSLLWDNEDFRIGEYFDTEKGKKVTKEKTNKPSKEKSASGIPDFVYKVPEDFKLELNTIYNMDCITFMEQVPDKFVDYVFTSPPYNIGKRTSFGKNNAIYAGTEEMYKEYEDGLSPEEYRKWLFKVIEELLRITKKHIFFNIQMLAENRDTVLDIIHVFRKNLKEIFIWNKTIASPNLNKKVVTSAFEFIYVLSNDKPHLRSFDDSKFESKFRNVITGVNSSQNEYKDLNKATFPLYLPRHFMNNFGKEGDIWYEPFNGTGTTPHAAILEKRDYIATELDPKQVVVTEARIDNEEMKTKFDFNQEYVDREETEEILKKPTSKAVKKDQTSQTSMFNQPIIERRILEDGQNIDDTLPFGD